MAQSIITLIEKEAPFEEIRAAFHVPFDKQKQLLKTFKLKHLQSLFQNAQADITLHDILSTEVPAMKEVIFHGQNSLPLFTQFQKRMCRAPQKDVIIGYNHQPFQAITGPGFFMIGSETDRPGEVMIDYTQEPLECPRNWPRIQSNDKGMGQLVYGGMKDYLRRITKNIFIGEATKKGQSIHQYFLLCREDLPKDNRSHAIDQRC